MHVTIYPESIGLSNYAFSHLSVYLPDLSLYQSVCLSKELTN